MKMTDCHSSVAFFIYCGAAVLVLVNGQQNIDDDIDLDEIAELRKELATSVGRIGKLEDLLAASVDIIAELKGHLVATSSPKPDTSKFNTFVSTLTVCVYQLSTKPHHCTLPKQHTYNIL